MKIELFRRLTPLFRRPVSQPIVPRAKRDTFTELADDLSFLAAELEPTFTACDLEALRQQSRYRQQQLILLIGGVTGAILGALQAVFTSAAWLGALVALLALPSAWFARVMRNRRALERYVDYRIRAERLRSLYFQYVTQVGPFGSDTRQDRLKAEVAAVLKQAAPAKDPA